MKNILLTLILGIFIISAISLTSAELGTYKQNECVNIKTVMNTSKVTINTISYPDSTIALSNKTMTKNGVAFNYTFCDTNNLGTYNYDYTDAAGDSWVNSFKISSTGTDDKFGLILLLSCGGFLLFILAIFIHNPYLGFFSGALFLIGGVYLMIYGLGDSNTMYSQALSYVSIGFGLFLTIAAAYEAITNNRLSIVGDDDDDY